ncbi:MAG: hypothetical protein HC916_03245 [Coleofasciculaceae cyanobacterium SM2_1_6]|nr:hypothetical protein [Coleofasciculaceae cyanobacterium SM2_1_6]
MSGGSGEDQIYGDTGNDTIQGDGGEDNLFGGEGDDLMSGGDGEDTLWGEAGDDNISGNSGDDYLAGGEGTDTLKGGTGQDFLNGQAGDDQISGDDGDDIIHGEGGVDQLWGGNGNDFLVGGTEGDYIDGGAGIDTASYYTSPAGVTVQLGLDCQSGVGDENGDLIINVENLEGSLYADSLIGDNQNNVINGLDGDDLIDGKAGNDSLYGQEGNDILKGREGSDLLHGGAGDDTLDGGSGNDRLIGATGNDLLNGGSGADQISGGEGDDTIDGGVGDDTILGGEGNDNILAGEGNDFVQGDAGDDTIFGDEGDDIILGGAGSDTIYGDSGDNLLIGGEGDDVLHGDIDRDIFGLSRGWGVETIYGFNPRNDKLGLFNGLKASQISFAPTEDGANTFVLFNVPEENIEETYIGGFTETLAILMGVKMGMPGEETELPCFCPQMKNITPTNFIEFGSVPTAQGRDALLAIGEPISPLRLTTGEVFPGILEPLPPIPVITVAESLAIFTANTSKNILTGSFPGVDNSSNPNFIRSTSEPPVITAEPLLVVTETVTLPVLTENDFNNPNFVSLDNLLTPPPVLTDSEMFPSSSEPTVPMPVTTVTSGGNNDSSGNITPVRGDTASIETTSDSLTTDLTPWTNLAETTDIVQGTDVEAIDGNYIADFTVNETPIGLFQDLEWHDLSVSTGIGNTNHNNVIIFDQHNHFASVLTWIPGTDMTSSYSVTGTSYL